MMMLIWGWFLKVKIKFCRTKTILEGAVVIKGF